MKKELWLRLRNYHFEHLVPQHLFDHVASVFGKHDASTHAFAAKIARKHKWTTRQALRAIDEYKKFVYLGLVSDSPVTPPKIIDTVWHEHLLFSKGYREFCSDVLQRDFDHNPELVPQETQTDVFAAQYDATLALYNREFNMRPPRGIWGETKFDEERRRAADEEVFVMTTSSYGDAALYESFDSTTDSCPEFGGGGGFSGGGGGDDWGDSGSSDSGSSDTGSSDSGSSDSGSSCSSSSCGSSCSSSSSD